MFANAKVRSLLRRIVPARVINLYWRVQRRTNSKRSVQEVFTEVYERNLWGGAKGEYCSGAGSDESHAMQYAQMVRAFIREKGVRTVVDLGCGDFQVGSRLQMEGVRYIGVDVVEGLINRNQQLYGNTNISFKCVDITSGELPDGELCLIRQVLQHLSNEQIGSILRKAGKFKYVLVTEHYPAPTVNAVPNKDKPHGGDTRIINDSGVYLDKPPFNKSISRLLLEVDAGYWLKKRGETHRTYLIENA